LQIPVNFLKFENRISFTGKSNAIIKLIENCKKTIENFVEFIQISFQIPLKLHLIGRGGKQGGGGRRTRNSPQTSLNLPRKTSLEPSQQLPTKALFKTPLKNKETP
jgi:hypothetical protein